MSRLLPPLLTILLVATLLPGIAAAQDEMAGETDAAAPSPPTIFVTSWMCDRGAPLNGVLENAEARDLPIAQELVNEGKLWSYSAMVHDWGDEWNYVTVMVASDMAAGLAANEAFGQRYEEMHGEDDAFLQACHTHRDNIYGGVFATTAPEGMTYETPYTAVMSYFACPFDMVDEVAETMVEMFQPAAQASVDAGMGYWAGAMRHAWADEWTYILVRTAKDVPSLIAFADDTNNRIMEGNPEGAPATDACAHKDNIYTVVVDTTPRAE